MQPRDEGPRTEDLTGRPAADDLRIESDEEITLDEPSASEQEASVPLVDEGERQAFLQRWKEIQAGFVDEPRGAVRDADGLVAEVMQHLARTFADARADLEAQWDRQDDVSTEDLRIALQRYRGFFNRLLEA
jgi:hypothetical protein